jgi:hypothetical protein
MIHKQAISGAYLTFFRPIEIIILEATGAHQVHISGSLHFKDLEIRRTLCDLQAPQGRIYVDPNLGIAVVAWLTDD